MKFPFDASGVYCETKDIKLLEKFLSSYNIYLDERIAMDEHNKYNSLWVDYKDWVIAQLHIITYSTNPDSIRYDYKLRYVDKDEIDYYKVENNTFRNKIQN